MALRRRQPSAADVNESDDLVRSGIDDSVIATIGTAAGLGLLTGPVFNPGASLFTPTIGMEGFEDVHGD
jgi:hypothetical protein